MRRRPRTVHMSRGLPVVAPSPIRESSPIPAFKNTLRQSSIPSLCRSELPCLTPPTQPSRPSSLAANAIGCPKTRTRSYGLPSSKQPSWKVCCPFGKRTCPSLTVPLPGLEKYAPAESKSPRGLTRFPNRNKFIAEYILKKTGQIRTAKQVGSRIQQLRDTNAGKHSEYPPPDPLTSACSPPPARARPAACL